MAVLSAVPFPMKQGNEFSNSRFQQADAANYLQKIGSDALLEQQRMQANSSLAQIQETGRQARQNAALAAEIARRRGLADTQALLLGGFIGKRGAGRSSQAEAAGSPMTSQIGNSLFSKLFDRIGGSSPAQEVENFNAFGKQLTDSRQIATSWAAGDQEPRALAGQALQGVLSGLRWQ